eukprot:5243130-Amphidinium_carterae.2
MHPHQVQRLKHILRSAAAESTSKAHSSAKVPTPYDFVVQVLGRPNVFKFCSERLSEDQS